ncbi:Fanconi anemia group J protein [Dispira simplex]|nr:Fanconi anemia group J protein [Dispira simplex]
MTNDSTELPSPEPAVKGSIPLNSSDSGYKVFPIQGVSVRFPFQPYPAQLAMMAKIVQALNRKENALLESPTGSGKSLAILCAALAWQEMHHKSRQAERQKEITEYREKINSYRLKLLQHIFNGNTEKELNPLQHSLTLRFLLHHLLRHPEFIRILVASNTMSLAEIDEIADSDPPEAKIKVENETTTAEDGPNKLSSSPPTDKPAKLPHESSWSALDDLAISESPARRRKTRKLNPEHEPRVISSSPDSLTETDELDTPRKTESEMQPPSKSISSDGNLPSGDRLSNGGFFRPLEELLNGPITDLSPQEARFIQSVVKSHNRRLSPAEVQSLLPDSKRMKKATAVIARISEEFSNYPQNWQNLMSCRDPTSGKNAKHQDERVPNPLAFIASPPSGFNAKVKIFVGSRTHKQISQLIKELKQNTGYRPIMSQLASRKHTCVHSKVRHTQDVNDKCQEARDEQICKPFLMVDKLVGRIRSKQRSSEGFVFDIEDLASINTFHRGCPYYAMRELATNADIVFCPYNYLIDPIIRESTGIELENSVLILDEAHNVEDVARDSASCMFNDSELELVCGQLRDMLKWDTGEHIRYLTMLLRILEIIRDPSIKYDLVESERMVTIHVGMDVAKTLESLGFVPSNLGEWQRDLEHIAKQSEEYRTQNAERVPARKKEKDPKLALLPYLSSASVSLLHKMMLTFSYVLKNDMAHLLDYRMGYIKRKRDPSQWSFSIDLTEGPQSNPFVYEFSLWCMNPGVIFRPLAKLCRSIVLTSGTLSPLNTFMAELQTKFPITLEANHIIDHNQLLAAVIPVGPKGYELKGIHVHINTVDYQDNIGLALLQLVRITPSGALCFFPSYSLIQRMVQRWQSTGLYSQLEAVKTVFFEPRQAGKREFEKFLTQFNHLARHRTRSDQQGPSGCLMLAVYRGKISEGIDFSDDACRAVINIGIPFPYMKDVQVMLKQKYNDEAAAASAYPRLKGSEWYSSQAYRAMNQALGRCIRHRRDWGVIIFLESRFTSSMQVRKLSKWIRTRIKSYHHFGQAIGEIQTFMEHWSERTNSPTAPVAVEISDDDL